MINFLRKYWPGIIVGLHFSKWIYLFKGINLTSEFPIVNVDYIQYYARVLRAHEYFVSAGRFWGYDPFDMAGYVSGPYHEVGSYFMSLAAHVLAGILPISRSVLFMEIAVLVGTPFLMVAVVRNFGGTRNQAWFMFAITVLYMGLLEPFSNQGYSSSLYGYQAATYLAIYQASLLWKWMEEPRQRMWVWVQFTVVSGILFTVHAAALLIVAAPTLLIPVVWYRNLYYREVGLLFASAFVVLLMNWFWIHPYIHYAEWKTSAPYFAPGGFKALISMFYPLRRNIPNSIYSLTNILLVVCVLAALRKPLDKTRSLLLAHFGLWLLCLGVITFFGDRFSFLVNLQPGRTIVPLWLVLCTAAVIFAPPFDWAARRNAVLFILVGAMLSRGLYYRLTSAMPPPFSTDLPYSQQKLLEFLKKEPIDGRVLLEGADTGIPHVAEVIPHLTKQILIGGPHPGSFIRSNSTLFKGMYIENDTVFNQTKLFNRLLKQYTEEELASYLRLYNVAVVVAGLPHTIHLLDRYPDLLVPFETAGTYKIYRVEPGSTWFVEGSGRLSVDYDRFVIDGASTGKLVLKFHWIDTFKTEPPVPITPVLLKNDPTPFIELNNDAGHPRLTIYNAGL